MHGLDLEVYADRYQLEQEYAAEHEEWLEEQERKEALEWLKQKTPSTRGVQ